jgi:hypothetical protein
LLLSLGDTLEAFEGETMRDYQRSAKVKATRDALFSYLADVRNLPRYFNPMTSAEPAAMNEVHLTADVNGKEVAGNAEFHVDKANKKTRWSSEGANDYQGELSVTGQGNQSEVAVKIHTTRAEGQPIEDGIQKTLEDIVRPGREGLIEGSLTRHTRETCHPYRTTDWGQIRRQSVRLFHVLQANHLAIGVEPQHFILRLEDRVVILVDVLVGTGRGRNRQLPARAFARGFSQQFAHHLVGIADRYLGGAVA